MKIYNYNTDMLFCIVKLKIVGKTILYDIADQR
jgi:hypothetical protein